MNRILRCLFPIALALSAAPAVAQTCSIDVVPTLDFGTQVGLPTPGTVVTADIDVTCSGVPSGGARVCVGIGAGTGTGSTVGDRRMSITTPTADSVQYALYQDAALSQPFGFTDDTRAYLLFTQNAGAVTKKVTIYGQLTAGQTGRSVGQYTSTLAVAAAHFSGTKPNCNGGGPSAGTDTFEARFKLDPSCSITAAPLPFGNVVGLTGHDAATNLAVQCTLNGAWSIALNGGSVTGTVSDRRMQRGSGTETVSYQLYRDSGRTLVWGETAGTTVTGTGDGGVQSVPVYGRVPVQTEQPSGTYSDTVTATVTY